MKKEDNSVLIVEDNQKHMEDAKRVLSRFGIEYDLASNLVEALGYFREYSFNGILSDVFFPLSEGGVERPSGVILCEYALEQNIPIVLCTDTYHHGPKTSPVDNYARKQGIPLIDSEDVRGDEEDDTKNWDNAVIELLIQQAIMENPEFSSQRERLNNLVFEGDVYSNDHPTYAACNRIAEEVIRTVSKEYLTTLTKIGANGITGRSFSVDAVAWKVLMKLPNFAENHGACQPYQVDLVAYDY